MTVSTLRPNGTPASTGIALTGGASAHAVTSDDSDSTYLTLDASSDEATLALGDLTLPAGAVIKHLAVRVRTAKTGANPYGSIAVRLNSGSAPLQTSGVTTNWSTPTTVTPITFEASEVDDSEVDTAVIILDALSVGGSFAVVNVYALYLDVTYVEAPAVNVTEPSASPVDDTNQPSIEWAATLDSDGGPQTRYQVRVFTDAQYGAGGFNAASSTATAESGEVSSAATSWQVDEPLPDDTYRAYVRVAQTVNGSLHWSDWDFIQFDIAVDLPAVPLLTLTAESVEGRILIELDDQVGDATTDMFELQRSVDDGDTWEHVRGLLAAGLIAPSGGNAIAYDYEAPNGTETTYRARALHNYSGLYAASAWVTETETWSSDDVWLKNANYPSRNIKVNVHSYADRRRPARQGVFLPLGATHPIVVTDTRGPTSGTLGLRTDTAQQRDGLDARLDDNVPLLLQVPAAAGEPDRWVVFGDHDRMRGIDKSFSVSRFETLPWVEVARPSGNVVAWPEEGS